MGLGTQVTGSASGFLNPARSMSTTFTLRHDDNTHIMAGIHQFRDGCTASQLNIIGMCSDSQEASRTGVVSRPSLQRQHGQAENQ